MLLPSVSILVDGGGNDCNGVRRYLSKFPSFHKIYVFEPNPFFHKSYEESDFILIKKAMWTSNCTLPFHISKDERQVASSLLEDKLCKVNSEIKPYFYDEPINVECVDFSEWIKENIKPNHLLTLKLDIEGAEYDVLWKMIQDNTIKFVNQLFVEFHQDTVVSKRETHAELIKELKKIGITPQYWD